MTWHVVPKPVGDRLADHRVVLQQRGAYGRDPGADHYLFLDEATRIRDEFTAAINALAPPAELTCWEVLTEGENGCCTQKVFLSEASAVKYAEKLAEQLGGYTRGNTHFWSDKKHYSTRKIHVVEEDLSP